MTGNVVADGYLTADDGGPVRFGGAFATGDTGFLLAGELYVIGRHGDSVKCLGHWLYAEDVEDIVAKVRPPVLRPVVLLGSTACESTALVLIDRRAAELAGGGRADRDRHVPGPAHPGAGGPSGRDTPDHEQETPALADLAVPDRERPGGAYRVGLADHRWPRRTPGP